MFHVTARKRDRDVDSDSDWDEDRYPKKSRAALPDYTNNHEQFQCFSQSTLPHRPSHTPSPPRLFTDIRSMTPAYSDHGGLDSPDSIICMSTESSKMDEDMDMDDDIDVRSQPPESPAFSSFGNNFMRPPMLQSSLFNADTVSTHGRIPTPIHPSFKRGGMSGLGYPMSGSAGAMDVSNMHVPSIHAPPPLWKGPKQESDERSRRMPSPISEDEDIPDTPTALTQSQLSRLSVSQAHSADNMDTDAPATIPSPNTPRGRKRSGAMTAGIGRFSMGYRDDCEKCRQRVPGHYSHFVS